MFSVKWKFILPVLTVMVIAIALVVSSTATQATLLSDAQMSLLSGGGTNEWCHADEDYQKCKLDVDCEDVICSQCNYESSVPLVAPLGFPYDRWCTGNLNNTSSVEACYEYHDKNSGCDWDPNSSGFWTSCYVDTYSDNGCDSPDEEDIQVGTVDCETTSS